jgi:hypothetical protein
MLATGFFVIHDASAGGQDDVATRENKSEGENSQSWRNSPELTRRKESVGPLLDVEDGHVEAGADDTSFVKSAGEIDDDFASAVVINNLELADVAVLHHNCEEFDDDLGIGADKDLAFTAFLGIVDALEGIG